jgi:monothiol glutaredoxin
MNGTVVYLIATNQGNMAAWGISDDEAGCNAPRIQYHPHHMKITQPKITAYLKTFCGWSEGIRAIMRKYDLPYEEKDIIKNPAFRWEMEQRSGQPLSPCVEIDGNMLADVSGEEVEKWMLANGVVQDNEIQPDAPIDSACTDEQHAAMAAGKLPVPGKIRFFD